MRGTTGSTKSHSLAGACQFAFWRVRISKRRFKPVLLGLHRGRRSDRFQGDSRASAHGRVEAKWVSNCSPQTGHPAESREKNLDGTANGG